MYQLQEYLNFLVLLLLLDGTDLSSKTPDLSRLNDGNMLVNRYYSHFHPPLVNEKQCFLFQAKMIPRK